MDKVASWSMQNRQGLFESTATRRKLSPEIIEKDFWVCWTLKHVFSLPMAPHILFKGGTSLSKVFGAIQRFSEDVDLSIHRDYLGFGGDNDPILLPSASKRDPQIAKLQQACIDKIREEFLPSLHHSFKSILGESATQSSNAGDRARMNWNLKIDPNDPQTLLFEYPIGTATSTTDIPYRSYVTPFVKLEMGARSDPYPSGTHQVISYSAEEHPDLFEQPNCTVNALEAERTFWEKATILHAEYHRPADKVTNERLSRHYYDLAQLATTEIADKAFADMSLLDRVATHKKIFFRSGWAKYDEARPGSLRLVPQESKQESKQEALRRDYDTMQEMFFGERPTFEYIISTLQALEERINSLPPMN